MPELKHRGYRLALDDFEHSPGTERLELADVVKLDIIQLGREGLSEQAVHARRYGAKVLAEKIGTHADHAYCLQAGCDLFQGYFYRRPELIAGRRLDASRLPLLRLIAALQDPAIELRQLERLLARDVRLSYRLLRYINSAFFGLRCEVSSIAQALALLGLEQLKRWATLTIFAGVDGKPHELTLTALVRARFCELAACSPMIPGTSSELFMLGLFSVIDALLDTPIEDLLATVPLPEEMRDALIAHRGEMGALLDCVTALEAGEFDRAKTIVSGASEIYTESLIWANAAADSLFGELDAAAAA